LPTSPIDWSRVERVLIVKLRSIGDTVLATPSLSALREFLPDAQIDILLEDWVAPLFNGFDSVSNVLTVGKRADRFKTAQKLRKRRYDVAINLHGGTTATFYTVVSRARERIGFSYYQYSFLYNRRYPSGEDFWGRPNIHSAEQQLALLGAAGVPVRSDIPSRLGVTDEAKASVNQRLEKIGLADAKFCLMHPTAAFPAKTWPAERFAAVSDELAARGFSTVAVCTPTEIPALDDLLGMADGKITVFDDLTLPEITALAATSRLFVGNDSGIAHIAAAVATPSVVIFGPSNIDNWRPWTTASNRAVSDPERSGDIERVSVAQVINAVDDVLGEKEKAG
jgi:predicted lipopolysaccharide heptosyltransferase III